MELLKPAERNVALYILSHLDDVIRMPIAVLAEKDKTSEETIIRMCRSLNFTGFKDLKLSIASAPTLEIPHNHNFELEKDTTILQMIQTNQMHNIDAIQR